MMDIHISLTEFNTILAALVFWQQKGMVDPASRSDLLQDIACPSDDDTCLDAADTTRYSSASTLQERLHRDLKIAPTRRKRS